MITAYCEYALLLLLTPTNWQNLGAPRGIQIGLSPTYWTLSLPPHRQVFYLRRQSLTMLAASWGEVMGASFSDNKNYVLWLLAFASG